MYNKYTHKFARTLHVWKNLILILVLIEICQFWQYTNSFWSLKILKMCFIFIRIKLFQHISHIVITKYMKIFLYCNFNCKVCKIVMRWSNLGTGIAFKIKENNGKWLVLSCVYFLSNRIITFSRINILKYS